METPASISLFTLIFLFFFIPSFHCRNLHLLSLDKIATNQSLFDGETDYFLFPSLNPDSQFEARISYPATNPAFFRLSLLHFVKDENELKRTFARDRDLLNTEKIMFVTNGIGNIGGASPIFFSQTEIEEAFNSRKEEISGALYGLQVTVKREGRGFSSVFRSPIVYEIVLEELLSPSIPIPVTAVLIGALLPLLFMFSQLVFLSVLRVFREKQGHTA